MSDEHRDRLFEATLDAVRNVVQTSAGFLSRKDRVKVLLLAAVEEADEQEHDIVKACNAVDAIFTAMGEEMMAAIAHDEQSQGRRG